MHAVSSNCTLRCMLQCMVDEIENVWRGIRFNWRADYRAPRWLVQRHQTVSKALTVLRHMVEARLGAAATSASGLTKNDKMIRVLQAMVDELERGSFRWVRTHTDASADGDRNSCASACRANASCRAYVYASECQLHNGRTWESVPMPPGRDPPLSESERAAAYSAWVASCSDTQGAVYTPLVRRASEHLTGGL
jgi:hypothetical protein